ncbi:MULTISPECIES: sensor histidine kinase [Methylobacterium]|uniref:Blue-light-activated histidine kinase n=1 Tax=Methylobacterium longum TaxID=767694 RepID=A0ABT8ATY7_9HYPH|nr:MULTISPECIES: PAS domain S-box protein [Methylobacterium]MCJ2103330.1 PAS domain S-box protein [Methylobacterium sp. E-046]MDN3573259.1 PAS domain S-box protein [Methylobacterium longum]
MSAWPQGGGEMAERIRHHDWQRTPLGPIARWSQRLTLMVEQVLANPLVASLVCGPERILLYNDAAAKLYGDRHPQALGRPLAATFPEGWATVAPFYERAFAGESVPVAGQPLDTRGEGEATEVFDALLIPVREAGGQVAYVHMSGSDFRARAVSETLLRASEARYRHLFNAIDEGFCTIEVLFDDAARPVDYRILSVNTAFEQQTGLKDVVGRTARALAPDLEPHWFETYGRIARTGRAERFEDRADALGRWYDVYAFPVGTTAQGQVAVLFKDVLPRKRAEELLRASEERFRGLVEGFGQFSWEASADGTTEVDSPGWRAFTGQHRDAWLGRGWVAAIHPDDRDATERMWKAAVSTGSVVDHEYRLWHAPSASWRWSNVRAVPITNPDGSIRKWSGVNIDVTDRHRLLARQEVLVNELQHRARNLLGVVAAVANRTLGRGGPIEAFEERLQALSRAQGLLSQFGSDTVEVGALVRAELAAHADAGSGRVDVAGPEIHLTARQVQNFALALHELATNAVKYGALRAGCGHLAVTWTVVPGCRERRRLALSWVESGVAIDPGAITRRGYGTELIQEALAYALQAEVDYALDADGVRCRIELPVS